jgi:mycothiol synthase
MFAMRRFVQSVDEPVWVEVLNREYEGREDWRAITVEEFLVEEKHPSFDPEGRFIAELDGKPSGVVHAEVDKLRQDGKGFIDFGVLPEYRGGQLDRQLIETGLSELRARGMTMAQTGADSEQRERIELIQALGFKLVRAFSMMEINLAGIPRDIGENKNVTIRTLRTSLDEDIELYNRLVNESFREHFNFRPRTLEETRHRLLHNPYYKEQEAFLAFLEGEGVGYVGIGIDEKYNLEKNVQAGDVMIIGVLKAQRRAGIGARLMLEGLAALKARGMTKAMLGVDDYNITEAMKLYEKVGFEVKKKYSTFEREL